MNFKVKRIATMALTGVMTFSAVAPAVTYAATPNTDASTYAAIESALEEALKADGVSQEEWESYINFVKKGVAQEPSTNGVASTVKKAVKFIVKHLDVLPSKTLRDAFKKYGGKIVDAIDTIDTWTWYGIAKALTAVGVPDSAADLIADFIVTWLI